MPLFGTSGPRNPQQGQKVPHEPQEDRASPSKKFLEAQAFTTEGAGMGSQEATARLARLCW